MKTDPIVHKGNKPGLALLCDRDGGIMRTIRDELGIGDNKLEGRAFTSIVDEGSQNKAKNLLKQLRVQGAVFDWQLNVPITDTIQTLHFAGGMVDDRLLIVAASNGQGMMAMYEELMVIGNEQANTLRTTLKSQAEEARRAQEEDAGLYDELSRLNNELAAMQRELAKKNSELEHLNELKNQFLGMAAHDLRGSLSAIQSCAEFLRSSFDRLSEEERQEFLDIIFDSSRFMAELLNDLLDVTKIESGKLVLDLGPIDLGALAEKNMQINRVLASDKEIELDLQSEDLPTIVADANKLEQVFSNLISNALKYSHAGTRVTVSLTQPDETHVRIAVADQGQGIPSDQLDKLFRPFTTTTVRPTAGEKSSGLGLVIVRKIVEGHGGTIRVDSEVGVGATFYVTLPINPEKSTSSS